MNTQVFLVNSYAPNHSADPTELVKGQLGMYGIEPTDLSMVNAIQLAKTRKILFALGRGDGKVLTGRDINIPTRNRNFIFKKHPFKAPIRQSWRVSVDRTAVNDYDEFTLTINHRFGFDESGLETNVLSYSIMGRHQSLIQLYEAIAREVNGSQKPKEKYITALATESGVVLTSYFDNMIFTPVLTHTNDDSVCADQCAHYHIKCEELTAPEAGSGYAKHVEELFKKHSVWLGSSFQENIYHQDPQRDFVLYSSENDIYEIQWTNQNQPQEDNGSVFNVFQTIFLVIPTSLDVSRIVDNMETLLGVEMEMTTTL